MKLAAATAGGFAGSGSSLLALTGVLAAVPGEGTDDLGLGVAPAAGFCLVAVPWASIDSTVSFDAAHPIRAAAPGETRLRLD